MFTVRSTSDRCEQSNITVCVQQTHRVLSYTIVMCTIIFFVVGNIGKTKLSLRHMIRLLKINQMMDFIAKMALYGIQQCQHQYFGIKMVILVNGIREWYLFETKKYKNISMPLQTQVF